MFWEKYTELCKSVGKSPNAVAEECGIKSTGSVTGWKKGAMPRNPVLKRIADYFHVPITYFYVDNNIENYVSSSLSDAMSLSENGQKNKPVTESDGVEESYESAVLNASERERNIILRILQMSPEQQEAFLTLTQSAPSSQLTQDDQEQKQ